MQKIITQVPWQQKWPLWCFTQYSVAWMEGGNKKVLFGDSPSTVSPKPQQFPHCWHVLGEKRQHQFISVPHTWLGASSVRLALKDVAGETRILVPRWEGSRRGAPGHQASPLSWKTHQVTHTEFTGFLSWVYALSMKQLTDAFIWLLLHCHLPSFALSLNAWRVSECCPHLRV